MKCAPTITWFNRQKTTLRYYAKILTTHLLEKDNLRILSAPCATGEEPYTIAALNMSKNVCDFEIIAGDVDKSNLEKAVEGEYILRAHQVTDIPRIYRAQSLLNIFPLADGIYMAKPSKELKNKIKLCYLNLLEELNIGKFDVIFSLNFIYHLSIPQVSYLINQFSKSLNEGGFLFIGPIPKPEHLDFVEDLSEFSLYRICNGDNIFVKLGNN